MSDLQFNQQPTPIAQTAVHPSTFLDSTHRSRAIRIAIVGDVHDRWDEDDAIALQALGIDLVLFVGDFGNESVDVVRAIAALKLPKAVVFGNHDAWYSASEWGIKKCPYDRQKEDRVQQQIDLLGDAHVGYGKLDFPDFNLAVAGSRPFSWGGSEWKNADFYRSRYGVTGFVDSTTRIVQAASSSANETIIFLGHCGPKGLGDRPDDPCGRDWNPLGGDYGDPDFADAIAATRQLGKTIPFVAFGHMHHQLRHTKQHQRVSLVASPDGTIYLNAASVPRVVQTETSRVRNFSLVCLQDGLVTEATLVWLDQDLNLVSETLLYRAAGTASALQSHEAVV